jgi:hypothetical protein
MKAVFPVSMFRGGMVVSPLVDCYAVAAARAET